MSKQSFVVAGGKADSNDNTPYEPKVDKDPFYRTMDIFNGVFNKTVKLSAGKNNCTDLKTIYINFGDPFPSKIAQELGPGSDDQHARFMLSCGHEWEGKAINKDGVPKTVGRDYGMCFKCGADQTYRALEHEWGHIIFKSDLAVRKMFCEQYAEHLLQQAPGVDRVQLMMFLDLITNAFDDLRVNSLWEKVYPGSAYAIWERWRYLAYKLGDQVNTSFVSYIFAVVFGVPVSAQCEFEPMRPVIEWAAQKVRYRGFGNMLIDVRVVLDRCMGALLAKMTPPPKPILDSPPPPLDTPPPPGEPPEETTPGDNDADQEDGDNREQGPEDNPRSSDPDPSSGPEEPSGETQEGGTESGQDPTSEPSSEAGEAQPQDRPLGGVPSSKSVPASGEERTNALEKLMQGAQELDNKEQHMEAPPEDIQVAKASQATRALMSKVLNHDLSDVEDLAGVDQEVESDMQQQIEKLKNATTQKSEVSQLTDASRSKLTIIEVTPQGTGKMTIKLVPSEVESVKRMRTTFFRAMGRQKAKRASVGNTVDIESLIQYRSDYQDPNIFENEDVNQGFAYSLLCDMSGSMNSIFPDVARAAEILKHALDFPFVKGTLWGFRGGQSFFKTQSTYAGTGDVWMYRYDRKVDWYTGTVPHRVFHGLNGTVQVPVECGGITPMNSAINVAASHLWRKMPAGMAKRMFLLTDGSPMQARVTGALIPEKHLRQYVAKEIQTARKHGVQVYTLVIGQNAITDENCLQMFGPRKAWSRVGREHIGQALAGLVLRNFTRYLRS